MLKHFSTFLGHDLKKGCQIIAVASAVIAIFLATFFFTAMAHGLNNVQNPDFRNYGSVHAFATVCCIVGVKQITHLIFCFILFTGSKTDNVYGLRSWLKSNVVGVCVLVVLGAYCCVLLFAAGSAALALACALLLLLAAPTKIYFGLVVNSYHSLLAPDHIWGASMRVADNRYPRSCHVLPPVCASQPIAVRVSA